MAAVIGVPTNDEVQAMVLECFRHFDQNKDGRVSREGLTQLLRCLDASKFDDATVEQVFNAADANQEGSIDYSEFVTWVMSDQDQIRNDEAVIAPCSNRFVLPARFQLDLASCFDAGGNQLGQVLHARDAQQEGRPVAIKKMARSLDPEAHRAFLAEVALAQDLDHPNISKVFDVLEQGANLFVVMEPCEGGDVLDRAIDRGHASASVTSQVLHQVASAMRYAHGREVLHKDLKPENIMFSTRDANDNSVKVIDWGLAGSAVHQKYAVQGPLYAAPEVVMAARHPCAFSAAGDLWSLGVVAYIMLSGRPPFWGTEREHVLNAQAERYPIAGGVWEHVPAQAKDLIRSLLKANPSSRLPLELVLQHPFLVSTFHREASPRYSDTVLSNLRNFKSTATFGAMCMTAVAKLLDHKTLREAHAAFRELDTNGDGVLSLHEIREGFGRMGMGNADHTAAMEAFNSLDLDGSASIDYTEFCAAAFGQLDAAKDEAAWSAFTSLDSDNSGRLSREELQKVLLGLDVQRAWSPQVCQDIAESLVGRYDTDGDNEIDFQEFMAMMRDRWDSRMAPNSASSGAGAASAYDFLVRAGGLASVRDDVDVTWF